MERLTEKLDDDTYFTEYDESSCIHKLGKLEDIEEKIGIDFITLFKALKNGIRIIDDGHPYNDKVDVIYSSGIPYGFKCKVSEHCVFFKDRDITWTLTKED